MRLAHISISMAPSYLPRAGYIASKTFRDGQVLTGGDRMIAFCSIESGLTYDNIGQKIANASEVRYTGSFSSISFPYDIFKLNEAQIEAEFGLITAGRRSQSLSDTNTLLGDPSQIFIEEGASVECGIFNVKGGLDT
jgi:hypothetical protein